jgi:hypothetical protein
MRICPARRRYWIFSLSHVTIARLSAKRKLDAGNDLPAIPTIDDIGREQVGEVIDNAVTRAKRIAGRQAIAKANG